MSLITNIKKYKELKLQMELLESQFKEVSNNIRSEMQNKGLREFTCKNGIVKVTPYIQSKFDSKSFKEQYPQLVEKFTRVIDCQPRMTVK